MDVVFRVDASVEMGSGHLARCLALADRLKERGAAATFVCREHEGNLCALPVSMGHEVLTLPRPGQPCLRRPGDPVHAPLLGVGWEEDAEQTVAKLGGRRPDWLVVDHYGLDHRWETRLRPHAGRIMVIDDLADRRHDCELLLDQNLYRGMEQRYQGLLPDGCRELLGPKYALLRPEFATARHELRLRDGRVRRLLVFFGGSDPTYVTEKALEALRHRSFHDLEIDVVVGAGNAAKERIREACQADPRMRFHCQAGNMAELISAADLALGAAGSSTWERCALGLPALVVTVARNQLELARHAAEKGLLFHLGGAESLTPESLSEALRMMRALPETLRFMSGNALATVDAKGAQRVAGILAPPQIRLREAREADCDALHRWRNAEETRRYIFDSGEIPLESHRSWFRNTLANPDRVLLIGEIAGAPVGVLRYDLKGEEALVSVYLVPGGQGQGVGSELIRCGSRWLKEHRRRIRLINAEIMRVNAGSLRAFEQAGYGEHHLTYREILQ